jgi:hypothetical protein
VRDRAHRLDRAVNVVRRVERAQAEADRAPFDGAQVAVDERGAVHPDSHGDPEVTIQDRPHVLRVDARDVRGQDGQVPGQVVAQ